MKCLIPGKTFLLGEYAALVGGSVIGLATGPGFLVDYVAAAESTIGGHPFSPLSPAGQLAHFFSEKENDSPLFDGVKNLKINLTDLFHNCGGFGKSTAEYMAVLIPWLRKDETSFEKMRELYRSMSRQSGAEVSGLDLAIQYFGLVTVYDSQQKKYSASNWKLKDYDFILVSTGNKIKTHEHLQKLDLKKISHFGSVSNPLVELYQNNQGNDFIRGLKEWSEFLRASGYMSEPAFELKKVLEADVDVLCAKPCGAMGADVIAVLCEFDKIQFVKEKIVNLKLQIQSTSADLLPGVQSQLVEKNLKSQRPADVG